MTAPWDVANRLRRKPAPLPAPGGTLPGRAELPRLRSPGRGGQHGARRIAASHRHAVEARGRAWRPCAGTAGWARLDAAGSSATALGLLPGRLVAPGRRGGQQRSHPRGSTMTVSAIGFLILALICGWIFGGIALRLGGALIAVAGLLGLSLSGNRTVCSPSRSASASGSPATCISACATAPSRARSLNASSLPPHLHTGESRSAIGGGSCKGGA
jgi:hypothetical protein